MPDEIASSLAVLLVAAAAPLIVALLPGRVPQVVVLLVGGVLIGPQVLGVADRDSIALFATMGLGYLFLLAGCVVEPSLLRERPGKLAVMAWGITVALALAIVGGLEAAGFVRAFLPVSLALTTTALGTLIPILRDHDMLGGRFGRYMFAGGAVGEMGPVLAIALFLGAYDTWVELLGIATVSGIAFVVAKVPDLIHDTRVGRAIAAGQNATSQTTLRLTAALLVGLILVADRFGIDVVLGAFFAGMVLRRWGPSDADALEGKLDAVGYGIFIPVFFVASGISLYVASMLDAPQRVLVFVVLLLAVRGAPALLVYRNDLVWPRVASS